ncbi:MAG: response regulator [Firmicutes bacterium]|nr:response regulator [Bacillota bacterium]
MWRAILVDDEEFVRTELTALFPWAQFGFDLVGEAENARDALDLIDTTETDLVITDIRMPETDGLELIAWIGQRYPQIVVAVVSAHDDFQFVREALRLGAVDYLIKAEATPETAGTLLKRVGDILENRRFTREKQEKNTIDLARYHQIAMEAFWRDALTRASDEKELELQGSQLGIDLKDNNYGLIFIHVSNEIDCSEEEQTVFRKDLEAKINSYWDWDQDWNLIDIKQGNFVIITNRDREKFNPEMVESLERVARQLTLDFPEKLTISASSRLCAFHELPGNFREVREVNLLRLYHQTGGFISPINLLKLRQAEPYSVSQLLSSWESMIRGIELDNVRDFINELFKIIIPNHLCPEEARKLTLELITILHRVSFEYQIHWEESEGEITDLPELLGQAESIREWQILIEKNVAHYFRSVQAVNQPQSSLTIQKALAYVQSNFTRDLTLEEVADHVGVSKSYLSRIFPEYAGKHFCSYLQQLRIERAKELLRFTDDHIYEIASKVGFWNSRYFGKVFRDMVGITPADYRRIYPSQEG